MAITNTNAAAALDAIIRALYDVISGPAGARRNGRRFRSLFLRGARLIPTNPRPDGRARARLYDVDEFFQSLAENTKAAGFFEKEIARQTDRYGHIAHVFSTYESRRAEDDPEPFARGINSIQLFWDGRRWWVVTIFWDFERPGNPLPKAYIPNRQKTAKARAKGQLR